jgi:hypothetical protein
MPILKLTDEEWDCLSGCACECGYEYLLDEIIQLKDYDPVECLKPYNDKKSHDKVIKKKFKKRSD